MTGRGGQHFVLNEQTAPHQDLCCPRYLWYSSSEGGGFGSKGLKSYRKTEVGRGGSRLVKGLQEKHEDLKAILRTNVEVREY